MSAITFEALITQDQYSTGMDTQAGWMPVYRMGMMLLTRSHDDLLEAIRQDDTAEAMLELLERLDDYLKWRGAETDMLESARARLALVLMQFADELEAEGEGQEGKS